MTDRELFWRYVAEKDQQAYGELVRRHMPWVYSCARRLVREGAEDVAQAVFILLARKGAGLGEKLQLERWLFRATQYCAREALRSKGRRQKHEWEAAMQQALRAGADAGGEEAGAKWEEVWPVLDEAVGKLRPSDRQAVLLRFYRGLSFTEVAAAIGVGEEAAKKRVGRALEKLRGRLTSKGICAGVAGLGVVMTEKVTQAAGPTTPSLTLPQGGGDLANTIAKGAGKMMAWAKVKVAAGAFVALSMTAVGLAEMATHSANRTSAAASMPAAVRNPAAPSLATASSPQADQKGATDAANAFLNALRDRDAQRLAAIVAGETPEARLATAGKYIAEIRDREYARFPQRLNGIVGSMFTTAHEGPLTSAGFEVDSPIDAETRRLSLTLTPSAGKWLVTAATMPLANSIQKATPPLVLRPATRSVPAGVYAKAFDIVLALHKIMHGMDPAEKPDRQAAAKALDDVVSGMEQLTAVLKGTDLEWPDEVMRRAKPEVEEMKRIVLEEGLEGLAWGQKPDRAFKDAGEAFTRVFSLENELAARIEAEKAASRKTARPVSYGAPMELTLGWSGEKVTIPGPPELPTWFKEGSAYKVWQQRHNIQSFNTTDDEGNRYEISLMGASREADGSLHDDISGLNVYRPDGTLAAASSYYSQDKPTSWGIMNKSGTRYVWKVTVSAGAIQGYLEVCRFDEAGNQRIWTADRENQVWREKSADAIGEHRHLTQQVDRR